MLKLAQAQAYRWIKNYTKNLKEGGKLNKIKIEKKYSIYEEALHIEEKELSTKVHSWDPLYQEEIWNSARSNLGIIEEGGKKKLQIWRAMLPIEDYISIIENKRKSLEELLEAVRKFKNDTHPRRFLNCLLTASPGWGKTFLAKSLSRMLDMKFMDFNITHITSFDNLIDCFDEISSAQNQQPDKRILVFIDEINASIGNESVYSYFLSPIWDGIFKRGTRTFQLTRIIHKI